MDEEQKFQAGWQFAFLSVHSYIERIENRVKALFKWLDFNTSRFQEELDRTSRPSLTVIK